MISFYSNQIPSECKARLLTILATLFLVKLLQSLVITAKHLMRTKSFHNLQFQTSKHKSVWGIMSDTYGQKEKELSSLKIQSGSTNFYTTVTTMISGYLPLPPCLATGFLCLMLQTAAPTHKK